LISFRLFELIIDPYFSSEFENAIIIILDPFLEFDFKKKKTYTNRDSKQTKPKQNKEREWYILLRLKRSNALQLV
jgi:hypothetical protein